MSTCRVHSVRFYDLEPRAIHCMAYESTQRKLAVSRSDSSIEVWDLAHTPHIERTIPGRVNSSVEAITWCGERLFSAGLQGTITEYNLQTLSYKFDIPVTAGPCWCLESNCSNTRLAAGTEDGYINIFTVTNDGLMYEKILDRQEGRILCLAWDATGDVIITGSADAVRIWNVDSGHAIHRMTPGRDERKKETIIWCLAVIKDFTIISGDSRGCITFWDGNTGTQIESFQTHKADILCLCLAEDENSVYCAGVDPLIISFTKVWLRGGTGTSSCGRSKWVKSVQRRIHDHDVRALALADGKLLSAGVDSYLAISSYPPRQLVKYPPLLQAPSVSVCPEARCIMLRYLSHLEVWQLGNTAPIENGDEIHEGILPLIEDPIRLLTLKSRGGDAIVCADMSSNGKWIAYSSVTTLCFFSFQLGSKPSLQKAPVLCEVSSAHRITFTSDSTRAIVSTSTGDIVVIQLGGDELVLEHVFHPLDDRLLKDAVHLLTVSHDGQFIVAGDHCSNIIVWTTADWKHHCSLPRYSCVPTALSVHPRTNVLVIVYSDHKVVEYSLCGRKYTTFSRGLEGRHPVQWLSRGFAVNSVTFDPNNEDIIMLQDDNTICIIDKDKELPLAEAKIPRVGSPQSLSDSLDSSQCHPRTTTPQHAFHVIKKYKHLVHVDWLSGDELIAVEVNPLALAEKLPASLKEKRFGVM
ncbi:U3 small nucleolar RNA-associated protein 4 homolog [Zootermopsis nevadensis]|uniref:Cirhin n=1 Tax=Zootermopsis nevadensis TaxID=136037 RepID=A0A067R9R6_ZOONE|nr:U3 small nucleolar RNA-associated protein 4 homolog [Zootermopsis nevadensis]KDR20318.1 Cirhin [Zootermopsis nevadensis]